MDPTVRRLPHFRLTQSKTSEQASVITGEEGQGPTGTEEMRGSGHGRALKACANRARLATGPYPVPPWSSAPRPALLALQLSDSILLGVQMAQEDGAVRAQHLEQLLLVAAEAVLRVSSLEDLARLQV